MLENYKFPFVTYRARCERVVDGDTAELFVDLGFHSYRKETFRLYGIDTPELRSQNKIERGAAKDAKEELFLLLEPESENEWPLRIEVLRDPDSFGRYLAKIYTWICDEAGGKEVCVNDKLVEDGYAIYREY